MTFALTDSTDDKNYLGNAEPRLPFIDNKSRFHKTVVNLKMPMTSRGRLNLMTINGQTYKREDVLASKDYWERVCKFKAHSSLF